MSAKAFYKLTKPALLLILFLLAWPCFGHQIGALQNRLDIVQQDAQYYQVRWRSSEALLEFKLPAFCQIEGPLADNFNLWRCEQSIAEHAVVITGLSVSNSDALVRIQQADGSVQAQILSGQNNSIVVQASPNAANSVFVNYLWLGVEHIALGFDHLLFVLTLMLIIHRPRRLVLSVSAFTLAHSITLALAALGWINVNMGLVETLIALSILFLAVEAVQQQRGQQGWSSAKPWMVAFCFGLLHGLGFANVLNELGLPRGEELLSLISFNLGVELGQLAFIVLLWPLLYWLSPQRRQGNQASGLDDTPGNQGHSPAQANTSTHYVSTNYVSTNCASTHYVSTHPTSVASNPASLTTNHAANWQIKLRITFIYFIGTLAAFWLTERLAALFTPLVSF